MRRVNCPDCGAWWKLGHVCPPRCPDCGLLLRSTHNCKLPGGLPPDPIGSARPPCCPNAEGRGVVRCTLDTCQECNEKRALVAHLASLDEAALLAHCQRILDGILGRQRQAA